MQIPVSEAKAQLTDLVRRAEAGDEMILTRHGQAAVRLVPVLQKPSAADRRRILEAVRAAGRQKAATDSGSQHSLYDDKGLPR